jgi:hypothetical protein
MELWLGFLTGILVAIFFAITSVIKAVNNQTVKVSEILEVLKNQKVEEKSMETQSVEEKVIEQTVADKVDKLEKKSSGVGGLIVGIIIIVVTVVMLLIILHF